MENKKNTIEISRDVFVKFICQRLIDDYNSSDINFRDIFMPYREYEIKFKGSCRYFLLENKEMVLNVLGKIEKTEDFISAFDELYEDSCDLYGEPDYVFEFEDECGLSSVSVSDWFDDFASIGVIEYLISDVLDNKDFDGYKPLVDYIDNILKC